MGHSLIGSTVQPLIKLAVKMQATLVVASSLILTACAAAAAADLVIRSGNDVKINAVVVASCNLLLECNAPGRGHCA